MLAPEGGKHAARPDSDCNYTAHAHKPQRKTCTSYVLALQVPVWSLSASALELAFH